MSGLALATKKATHLENITIAEDFRGRGRMNK